MADDNSEQDGDNTNNILGARFLPTSNRLPKDEYRLIAIDIYGRYVMEYSLNRNNITYMTKEEFERSFAKCN